MDSVNVDHISSSRCPAAGASCTALYVRAARRNTVIVGRARFTVITSSLLRLEVANPHGEFDDRPSLVMSTADQLQSPVPPFTVERERSGSSVVLTTEHLVLRFSLTDAPCASSGSLPHTPSEVQGEACFSPEALNITIKVGSNEVVWKPGMQDPLNLNGTLTSLDCYDDIEKCIQSYRQNMGQGLISRAGWATFDDSKTGRLESNSQVEDGWRWFDTSTSKPPAAQDIYFFGHGHRYKQALADFMLIAGKPGLPPLSAFGIWWSRFWVYSSKSFTEQVLDGYAQHALPLNHVVMDMDWHKNGWGGYSWNRSLFPDPVGFLNGLHSTSTAADGGNPLGHPLKVLLNVHPGPIGHEEDRFVQFAHSLVRSQLVSELFRQHYTSPPSRYNMHGIAS